MLFEQLRTNGRIDVSAGINSKLITIDEEETKGARNKFWFNNYEYLFKEIYSNSYEDYAEIIASDLAAFLGIPCASYDLAIYNNRKGVISKNFVNEDEGDELIQGTEVINEVYQKYISPLQALCKKYYQIISSKEEKKVILKELITLYQNSLINAPLLADINQKDIDNYSDEVVHYYLNEIKLIMTDISDMYKNDFDQWSNGVVKANNLFDLSSVIDIYCKINNYSLKVSNEIIKKLVKLFIYDIITSQGDRHSDNWGLIINEKTNEIKFSPIYDNSNICNLNRSKALKTIASYIESLKSSKVHIKKKIKINERLRASIYHEKSLLKVEPEDNHLKNNNVTMINEFITQSSSEIKEEVLQILTKLTPENIDKIFQNLENKIKSSIPDEIKMIVKQTIEINVEELYKAINDSKEIIYGK